MIGEDGFLSNPRMKDEFVRHKALDVVGDLALLGFRIRGRVVAQCAGHALHAELVRAWKVKIAPTVLFLGAGGREVAERLEGGSPDFYSGYLDQRLEQARRAIAG